MPWRYIGHSDNLVSTLTLTQCDPPFEKSWLRAWSSHIVIVVSPLLSLIKDQTECLGQAGISCISLSDASTQGEIDLVVGGFYSVVYATPESLLKNERWRRMLSLDMYQQKVCAIPVDEAHVMKQW